MIARDARAKASFSSGEVFCKRANAPRGPCCDAGLGLFGDDGDHPGRRDAGLVFEDRSNKSGDGRTGRADSSGSAVELGDTETPHFFLIARFKREHEGAPWSTQLSRFNVIRL